MLVKMWRNWTPMCGVGEILNSAATMEDSMKVPQIIKNRTAI